MKNHRESVSIEAAALQIALETLSCAVVVLHRARTGFTQENINFRRRTEELHKGVMDLAMDVAEEAAKQRQKKRLP